MGSGTTQWKNAVRNVLAMLEHSDGVRELTRKYSNYTKGKQEPIYLRFDHPDDPILRRCPPPKKEPKETTKEQVAQAKQETYARRYAALYKDEIDVYERGLTHQEFAQLLAGIEPPRSAGAEHKAWAAKVEAERVALKSDCRSKLYAKLGSKRVYPGGTEGTWRWHIMGAAA
jgi:hypothetical protein